MRNYILYRYIGSQTFYAILSTFAISLILILFIDMIELLRRGQGSEQFGITEAFILSSLRLPILSEKILPFAVLFGSMFAFLKLNRRQELVIARSSGLSIWEFLAPPIIIAFLIGIIGITILNPAGVILGNKSEVLEAKYLGTSGDCRNAVVGSLDRLVGNARFF